MIEQAKKVLQFWKFLEILQTGDFSPGKKQDQEDTFRICKVFESQKDLEEIKTQDTSLDICCYSIRKSVIEEYFINKENIDDKRIELSKENICLFGFQVNNDFIYEQNYSTFFVSPYLWFLNQLFYKNNDTTVMYRDYIEFCDTLKNLRLKMIFENDNINIIDKICAIKDYLLAEIPFLKILYEEEKVQQNFTCFYSKRKNNSAFEKHESKLVNSFFLEDLDFCESKLKSDKALCKYILSISNQSSEKKRYDVKIDKETLLKFLNKKMYPLGKWPSKYSPALMQQLAVNISINENSPLFSVNGPPGTGKTTLLKEIIADTIVKRAIELCKLNHPGEAFEKVIYKKDKQKEYKFSKLKSQFLEYSILVTSCNNSAVENITKELPQSKGFVKDFDKKDYRDYFDTTSKNQKIAYILDGQEMFDSYFDKLISPKFFGADVSDIWGIISVPLGKSANIKNLNTDILDKYFSIAYDSNIEENIKNKLFGKAKHEFLSQYNEILNILNSLNENVSDSFLDLAINSPEEVQYKEADNISKKFNEARENLFCKAMNVHKAFVLCSYDLPKNLKILQKCLSSKDLKDKLSEYEKTIVFGDCFSSLFLLTPVISTTFASVQKMLKYMNTKMIGKLIVDESGQASPQCVIGAMSRAKKTIIVGDPMQVEPVVTISPEIYEDILKTKLSSDILPYFSQTESVQTFADRINQYGSYIGKGNEKKWVGCPLIVHRRCISPMFDISNALSYGGTMINCTAVPNESENHFLFPYSCWIDISGKEEGIKNHAVQEQYKVVKKLLDTRITFENEIYIISPFKTVAGVFHGIDNFNYKDNAGTVHKFQGKEAEEVFLVLGCSESSQKAVEWVNANIVNVAVTRAKYRLYVVGDWNLWSKNRNIKVMQKYLVRNSYEDIFFKQSTTEEVNEMIEDVKSKLESIAEEIEEIRNDAFEEGKKFLALELKEKLIKANVSAEIINQVFSNYVIDKCVIEKQNSGANKYEEFMKKFPNTEIEFTSIKADRNDRKWYNFIINSMDVSFREYDGTYSKKSVLPEEMKSPLVDLVKSMNEDEIKEKFQKKNI